MVLPKVAGPFKLIESKDVHIAGRVERPLTIMRRKLFPHQPDKMCSCDGCVCAEEKQSTLFGGL